jgi:hypothetical protein
MTDHDVLSRVEAVRQLPRIPSSVLMTEDQMTRFISDVFNLICGTDDLLTRFPTATRHLMFHVRDELERQVKE